MACSGSQNNTGQYFCFWLKDIGVLPQLPDLISQKTFLVNQGVCWHLGSIEAQDYDQNRKLVTSLWSMCEECENLVILLKTMEFLTGNEETFQESLVSASRLSQKKW